MKIDKTKIINGSLLAVAALVLILLSYFRVFDGFELSTLDARYKLRPVQDVSKNIVIIEIGDYEINKIGQWPIPRKWHSLLLKALKRAEVKFVVFDIFFSETSVPEDDIDLANEVRSSGNVYMPYIFDIDFDDHTEGYYKARGYLAEILKGIKEASKDTGYINAIKDSDGKVRRMLPFVEYNGKFYPHITFLVALNDLGYSFSDVDIVPEKYIKLPDGKYIPLGEGSTLLVNYPGKWKDTFRHYSYLQIIDSFYAEKTGRKPSIDLDKLKGSICYIGVTAAASPDAHPSPMETMYPGVGVHASVLNSIINSSYIRRAGRIANIIFIILMAAATALLTLKSPRILAFLSIVVILVTYTVLGILLFILLGYWIDLFYPVISTVIIYIFFTFQKYLREIHKRELIEKELNIAKDIQLSFLPKDMPEVGGLDLYAHMLTARQVGGDLYDVVKMKNDDCIGIMLGDVSGKGVPASLFMARCVSVFKTFIHDGNSAFVVKNMNDTLASDNESGLFVTLTYMIFTPKNNKMEFASGGHNPALMITPEGDVKWLDAEEGMPLGMIEGDYSKEEVEYEPGSIFVLYTDGVTEAMDIKGNMFGEDRFEKVVKDLRDKDSKTICRAIHKAVHDFAGKAKQHDDITVLVIKTDDRH